MAMCTFSIRSGEFTVTQQDCGRCGMRCIGAVIFVCVNCGQQRHAGCGDVHPYQEPAQDFLRLRQDQNWP